MIKHDGYQSVVCPHHRDIVTCEECDIFSNIKDATPWSFRLRHPLMYTALKMELRKLRK